MDETRDTAGWSTWKFLGIVLAIDLVLFFVLNGVLNEVLGLGVPSAAIGAAPAMVVVLLLPRWRWFRARMAKR
ncbi:MAG: hypothetical protein IAG13_00940 [Deltaproteobacteria bacterium]|nr:hypothetical protein [Nannocystaceae bacterium]